jgi:hypothetical protein
MRTLKDNVNIEKIALAMEIAEGDKKISSYFISFKNYIIYKKLEDHTCDLMMTPLMFV